MAAYLNFFALQQINVGEENRRTFSTGERSFITSALGVNTVFCSQRLDWYACAEGHCWGVGDDRHPGILDPDEYVSPLEACTYCDDDELCDQCLYNRLMPLKCPLCCLPLAMKRIVLYYVREAKLLLS